MASNELTQNDLRSILHFTIALACKAGALILEGSDAIQSAAPIAAKKNSVDLVTEYDMKVEDLVRAEISKAYPDFQFIGEESYYTGSRPPLTDEPTFCVDPIDGTTNFVHGFPWVCISLGLLYKRRPCIGVIYNPFLDYLYTGLCGEGSHLIRGGSAPRRLPLAVPKPLASLSQAQIAVEWGSDRSSPVINGKSESFLRLVGNSAGGIPKGQMAHSLRSLGSAALNIAMVAQGGLDAYWEVGCWPWDVCAGIVVAQEAGCVVTGSHAVSKTDHAFDVTEDVLWGRKYLFVRNIAPTPEETTSDAQRKIVREFYDTVIDVEAM